MPWYDPVKEGNTQDAVNYLNNSPAAKRALYNTLHKYFRKKKQEFSPAFFMFIQLD